MSEEEKIIKQVKTMLENATPFDMPPSRYNALETMVNLIEKQQKEIKEYENKLNEVYTGWKNNIERNMKITDGAFNLERK